MAVGPGAAEDALEAHILGGQVLHVGEGLELAHARCDVEVVDEHLGRHLPVEPVERIEPEDLEHRVRLAGVDRNEAAHGYSSFSQASA